MNDQNPYQAPAREQSSSDLELLRAFRSARDEAAFAKLLDRHGAMVFSVCRRVLGDVHLAEDALQATFLVLATRSGIIKPPCSLAGWLYRVAYRTALKARGLRARKEKCASGEVTMDSLSAPHRPVDLELASVLDDEISRLPDKQRSAVILFCVHGRSRKEVAVELGVPLGTTSSLLTRAKERLRTRLARRGFAVGIASIGGLLSATASAAVPNSLAASTVNAAMSIAAGPAAAAVSPVVATLMKGAWIMSVSKTKIAALVAAVAITAGGTGTLIYRAVIAGDQTGRDGASDGPGTVAESPRAGEDLALPAGAGFGSADGAFGAEFNASGRVGEMPRTGAGSEAPSGAGYGSTDGEFGAIGAEGFGIIAPGGRGPEERD